jgi:hypothetical protein
MMALWFDVSNVRASSLSRRVEAECAPDVNQVEIRALDRVVASAPNPVEEWLKLGRAAEISTSTVQLPMPDLEWTSVHEDKFLDLAGREATGELKPGEEFELERLAGLRRGLKNPRRGEELLREYQQRELTRDLIAALSRYVTFHKPARHSQSAKP